MENTSGTASSGTASIGLAEPDSSSAPGLYASDIASRWAKVHEDMQQLPLLGVTGTTVADVYPDGSTPPAVPTDQVLPVVGFSSLTREPGDDDVAALVDEALTQVLGHRGLAEIIRPGDRVVIKVNIVGPDRGLPGEKGRGIISDPRIVRHVADEVRAIIGFGGNADLKVVDTTFTDNPDPSDPENVHSFAYARLQADGRTVWYDEDGDGILDGESRAQLVNLDSVGKAQRFLQVVDEPIRGRTEVWLPKFLRTRAQAAGETEYCDVFIGIPILKSHGLLGATGALKLHWGSMLGLLEKQEHAGYGFGRGDVRLFLDYLCAMNRVRGFDLVIMDALTANRRGPDNASEDPDTKTDFILTNAVLASRDSVAIDTVETLLAGYRLDSVPMLESAFRDGIGINRPAYIDLRGLDALRLHKQWLRKTYPAAGPGSYPLQDGWGNARPDPLSNAAMEASVAFRRDESGSAYVFDYTVDSDLSAGHAIARLDLYVNGRVVTRIFDQLSSGSVSVNLDEEPLTSYRIAVWDEGLNCTLSPEQSV